MMKCGTLVYASVVQADRDPPGSTRQVALGTRYQVVPTRYYLVPSVNVTIRLVTSFNRP